MGQENSKHVLHSERLTKGTLDVALAKIFHHCQIIRDTKKNEYIRNEVTMQKLLKNDVLNKNQEILVITKMAEDLNYIKGFEIIINCAELLRARTSFVLESLNDPQKISIVLPLIETIIYSVQYANLYTIEEFKALIQNHLSPELINNIQKSPNVNRELRKCFENIKPTQAQINDCWIEFANKNNISVGEIRKHGHEVYTQAEIDEQRANALNQINIGNNGYPGNPLQNNAHIDLGIQARNDPLSNNGHPFTEGSYNSQNYPDYHPPNNTDHGIGSGVLNINKPNHLPNNTNIKNPNLNNDDDLTNELRGMGFGGGVGIKNQQYPNPINDHQANSYPKTNIVKDNVIYVEPMMLQPTISYLERLQRLKVSLD